MAYANFGTIQTRVNNLVGLNTAITTTQLQQLIQAEHDSLLADHAWSNRKAESTLTTTATYTTGTLTTAGTAVTGTGTTWTSGMVNRWLRTGTTAAFYKITAFTDATHLTIETPIAEGDLTTAKTYTIFQHVYTLPTDCEYLISMVGGKSQNSAIRVQEISRQELDRLDSYRSSQSSFTVFFSYRELDANNTRQIELWPVPTTAALYRFQYLKSNSLVNSGDTPLYRSDLLVYKSAASAAFLLAAKTGDPMWTTLADRYLTLYKDELKDALMDDLAKSSPAMRIRDYEATGVGRGDDWWLDKAPLYY